MKKVCTTALLLTLCLTLVGCSSPSPTSIAEDFLTATKAQDVESIKAVYLGDAEDLNPIQDDEEEPTEDEDENNPLTQAVEEKMWAFDYVVSNEKIDGNTATVDVEITTYDLGTATTAGLGDYVSQGIGMAFAGATDEQMENLLYTSLANQYNEVTEKNYNKTVQLKLEQTDDGWKVSEFDDDEPIVDAMNGGMASAFNNFTEAWEMEE